MARNESHQKTRRLTDMREFPPTVTGHDNYANGVELILLDPGTQEEPRFIWVPDGESEETVFAL